MGRTQRAGRLLDAAAQGSAVLKLRHLEPCLSTLARATYQAAGPESSEAIDRVAQRLRAARRLERKVERQRRLLPGDMRGAKLACELEPVVCKSTAKIVAQPAMRAAITAARPTEPAPNTATELPGCSLSTLSTAPAPVFTPHANAAATSSGRSSGSLTTLPSVASVRREGRLLEERRRRGRAPAEGLAAVAQPSAELDLACGCAVTGQAAPARRAAAAGRRHHHDAVAAPHLRHPRFRSAPLLRRPRARIHRETESRSSRRGREHRSGRCRRPPRAR